MKITNFKLFLPVVIVSMVTYSPGFSLQNTNYEKAIIDVSYFEEKKYTKIKKISR